MARFAGFVIGVFGLMWVPGDAPAQEKAKDWKKEWGAFIDVLSPMFKRAAATSELKEKFEGQQVTWTGQIAELSFKPESNLVRLKMPAKAVTLSSGAKEEVSKLVLMPKAGNLKKWQDAKVGDTVEFKTTLKGDSIFPVVALVQGLGENAGKTIIVISTHDGELIKIVKK